MATKKESISCTDKSKRLATKRVFDSLRRRENVAAIQSLLKEDVDMEARDSRGRTLLLFACSRRRKEIVHLLIKKGANVNDKCNFYQYTVLHYASRYGWTKIVRSLVKKVNDLNALDVRGESALHHASTSGHLTVVKCLLKAGVLMDRKTLRGFTPLMNAAQFSRKHSFDLLLESGASVDGDERVFLYFALRNRWTETVQCLLKRACDNNERYVLDETALDATSSTGHLNVIKFLVEEGTNIDDTGSEIICQEALYHASYMGHLEVVKWLTNEGGHMKRLPDLDLRHKSGFTAMYIATSSGHFEVVKWLVNKGADINSRDLSLGNTALHVASDEGYLEFVKWLVEHGSDIHARDKIGDTALQCASGAGHLEIVKYLAEQGADINTLQYENCSPLHFASVNGHFEVVKWLVEKESDLKGVPVLDGRSSRGHTALHFASAAGHLEIVKWLAEKGADINVKNCRGETPLIAAAVDEHKHVVDFLMCSGANPNGCNYQKLTMLHMASASGWIDTVQALIKGECDLEAKNVDGRTALADACFIGELGSVRALLQAGARWEAADISGFLLHKCLTKKKKSELIKLFIENGAYIRPIDYATIMSSLLEVLQDANLCFQAIVNKFNNYDLPELYKLRVSEELPTIENMKIASGSKIAQAVTQNLEFEIQTNGHCNVLEVRPKTLIVLSVESVSKYYTKKTN